MGIYSYGYKAGKKLLQKVFKPQKTTGTEVINAVNPNVPVSRLEKAQRNTRLAQQKRKDTYKIFDIRKKAGTPPSTDIGKTVNKVSAINKRIDKILEKKAKGGRVGLKRGTSLMPKKKSNVDKIKKTFGPKSLGMQSVIYGLDKNPNITKADPKAKFIAAANKKKKKVI